MKITLADIEHSEEICWAVRDERPGVNLHYVRRTPAERTFDNHARTQLPAMNALVREMLDQIRWLVHSINTYTKESGNTDIFIEQAKARRLIERIEGSKP